MVNAARRKVLFATKWWIFPIGFFKAIFMGSRNGGATEISIKGVFQTCDCQIGVTKNVLLLRYKTSLVWQ